MNRHEIVSNMKAEIKAGETYEGAYAGEWMRVHDISSTPAHAIPSCDERKVMALDSVYASSEPMSLRQIADEAGLPPKAMQNILTQLVKHGKLERTYQKPDGSEKCRYKNQTIHMYSKSEIAPKFEGRHSAVAKRIGKIINLLKSAGKDFSVFELSQQLGINHSLIKNTIHYMKQDRLVQMLPKSPGRGKAGQHASTYIMRETP